MSWKLLLDKDLCYFVFGGDLKAIPMHLPKKDYFTDVMSCLYSVYSLNHDSFADGADSTAI